jgi:DNA adenine methylase
MKTASPLRYPGGKWRLSAFFQGLIETNFAKPPSYIEPYAGGASLALSLLFAGSVGHVWLNDLDPAIYAFWSSALNETDRFCDAIATADPSLRQWKHHKEIYRQGTRASRFNLGFATFFLNRTNYSGILNGGVIGGKAQKGLWTIDARFNKDELIQRVARIGTYRKHIKLTNLDASRLLASLRRGREKSLVYLDPPYVKVGKALYLNAYSHDDHSAIRDLTVRLKCPWVVSYDDVQLIHRLYRGYRSRSLELLHTAREAKIGREVLFFSEMCSIPRSQKGRKPDDKKAPKRRRGEAGAS